MDIVILAMVACFIALRLYSVLGRRTGNERRDDGPSYGLNDRSGAGRAEPSHSPGSARENNVTPLPNVDIPADTELGTTLAQIESADRQFDAGSFTNGASAAYKVIIEAFANGDRDALGPLLNDEVYASFEQVIADREEAGQDAETQLVDMVGVDIVDAVFDGRQAEVDVRFQAEVLSAVHDSEGRVIDGNPSEPETVVDRWTFARDVKNSDPNWLLIATERESE